MFKVFPLCYLNLYSRAKVLYINCADSEKQRFLDLGIAKGTVIVPLFRSPFGDPTAYEIRKTIIALRKEISKKILVAEF